MKRLFLSLFFFVGICCIYAQQGVTTSNIKQTLHIEDDGFVWYELEKNGSYGANNVEGKCIIPIKYSDISYRLEDYSDGDYDNHPKQVHYFEVEEDDEYTGAYTREGTLIISTNSHYTDIFLQHEDDKWCWNVEDDSGNEGLLDIKGNIIIPTSKGYENVQIFKSYIESCPIHISFYLDDYNGICDLDGNIIIAPDKYKECRLDYTSLKVRTTNDEWKTIPLTTKVNQNTRFDYKPFDNIYYKFKDEPDKILKAPNGQVYHVKSDGTFMNVYTSDRKKLLVSSRLYKQIDIVSDQNQNWCYKVSNSKSGGSCGLLDKNGKVIVSCELDALEVAGNGFLRFKIGSFWGVMNYAGKIIIPTDRGYTKIGNYVSFTKRFPYEMAGYKGECNNLGVQVSKIKVATPVSQQTQTATTQTTTQKETTSQKQEEKKVIIEHRRDPIPVQQWQACFACGGMGTMGCDFCGGSGTKYIGDNLRRCSRCNGQGIIPCNVCFGNKGKYITVYQ